MSVEAKAEFLALIAIYVDMSTVDDLKKKKKKKTYATVHVLRIVSLPMLLTGPESEHCAQTIGF